MELPCNGKHLIHIELGLEHGLLGDSSISLGNVDEGSVVEVEIANGSLRNVIRLRHGVVVWIGGVHQSLAGKPHVFLNVGEDPVHNCHCGGLADDLGLE